MQLFDTSQPQTNPDLESTDPLDQPFKRTEPTSLSFSLLSSIFYLISHFSPLLSLSSLFRRLQSHTHTLLPPLSLLSTHYALLRSLPPFRPRSSQRRRRYLRKARMYKSSLRWSHVWRYASFSTLSPYTPFLDVDRSFIDSHHPTSLFLANNPSTDVPSLFTSFATDDSLCFLAGFLKTGCCAKDSKTEAWFCGTPGQRLPAFRTFVASFADLFRLSPS